MRHSSYLLFILFLFTSLSARADATDHIIQWSDAGLENGIEKLLPKSYWLLFEDSQGYVWIKPGKSAPNKYPIKRYDSGEGYSFDTYHNNAVDFCADINVGFDLWQFRLPSPTEIQNLVNDNNFSLPPGIYWTNNSNLDEKPTEYQARASAFDTRRKKVISERPAKTYGVTCVSEGIRNSTIEDIANVILADKLKSLANNEQTISKPVAPLPPEAPKYLKGEFETTEMFQTRKMDSNKKIQSAYNEKLIEYNNAIRNWEENEALKAQQYNDKSESFETNLSSEKAKSLEHAVNFMYGAPKIKSAVYDADRSEFSIQLVSKNSLYDKNVVQRVPLSYARKYKEILLANDFKPTVKFIYSDERLIFQSISELIDPQSVVQSTEYNLAKNSIPQIKAFISKYPESSLVPEAKNRILQIEAQQLKQAEDARIAQEALEAKRLKNEAIRKKRAEEKARRDAYDYEHACERYYVGYVGQLKGTGWFATNDSFVIRYTNFDRKSVTIEGTESGNSLEYGKHVELSCFDLLQNERNAQK